MYTGETAKKLATRLNEYRKSVRACNPTISSLLWRCYGQCTSYWPGKPPALTQDMSKFARSSKNCEKLEKLQFLLKLLNSSGKGGRRAPSKNCDFYNSCDFSKNYEILEKSISQFLRKLNKRVLEEIQVKGAQQKLRFLQFLLFLQKWQKNWRNRSFW